MPRRSGPGRGDQHGPAQHGPAQRHPAASIRFLRLRIALWRLRPVLVTALVLVGVATALRQIAPPPAPTRPVVVAARDLPSGQVLAAEDLTTARQPPDLAPDGAARDPQHLLGRTTAVGLPEGLPVVPSLLEGTRFALDPPPGTVVVAVPLAASTVVGFLRAGDVVDLVVPGADPYGFAEPGSADRPEEPRILARGALVLQVGADDARQDDIEPLGSVGDGGEAIALVAVDPVAGGRLAAVAAYGALGAVLVG